MPTTIFGQYIGFWFGTLTAISFFFVFITCRIWGRTSLPKRWGKLWDPVHWWAWRFAILFASTHISLITLGYVFDIWF